MEAKDVPKDDINGDKAPEQITTQDATFQQPLKKTSKPKIAGILLIIAGIISILFFIQIAAVDNSTVQSVYNATKSQLMQSNTNLSQEQLKQSFIICGSIGVIFGILSILGGVLSLKRKIWGLALVVSIPQSLLGIIVPSFSLLFMSGIMALVGLLLIVFSRKEFQ